MTLGPRNTLVEVEIVPTTEQKLGGIVIPNNSELYAEAIIRAIGPGNINSVGARSETHDLAVGQRVLVQRYQVREMSMSRGLGKSEIGVRFTRDNKTYLLFEQTAILYILQDEHADRLGLNSPPPAGYIRRSDGSVYRPD